MSDFGSEVGNSALMMGGNVTTKLIETILKLFEKTFDTWEKAPERKLKKNQLRDINNANKQKELLKKIDGKIGFVNYKELRKAGVPLSPVGIYMTKEEMKEFANVLKREGLKISALVNKNEMEKMDNEQRCYEVVCRTEDLEKIAKIVDRLNDEKLIEAIDKNIEKILMKGEENLTEQDKSELAMFNDQKCFIQKSYCKKLNNIQKEGILEKAIYGKTEKEITFHEALNSNTGRSLDKGVYCIVADAKEPQKHIRCHGYNDTFKGKNYVKTEYEVYKGNKKIFSTHDGRFEGRPVGYWEKQKEAIKEAGDFGDTVLKFYSVTEYQKWAKQVELQNEKELSMLDVNENEKDYEAIIKELEKQLDKVGCVYKQGKVVNKETGEGIAILEDNMEEKEKILNSESIIIGKQIENYNDLKQLQSELAIAKAEMIANDGTEEKEAVEQKLKEISEKYQQAIEKEKSLISERKNINAIQVEQELEDKEQEQGDKKQFNMVEVKEWIEKEKGKKEIQDKTNNEPMKIKMNKEER